MRTTHASLKRFAPAIAGATALIAAAAPLKAAPVTDIVFMIDASSSMGGEIAGVRAGFGTFATNLAAQGVDARFAIVMFGGAAELIQDFTSDATATQNKLNQIIIGNNPGIHNNHNANPEAGLEAIRMVLGGAPTSTLDNNNIPEDGILDFRSGARKNLILATDEDSDLSFHVANRFPGQAGNEPPNPINATWQAEVDATADIVIAAQAYLNLLVNRCEAASRSQYGDPEDDVSDADFSNWDPSATLANLLADAVTAESLEAQVLQAGLVSRAFDVGGANDSDFVTNFFAAKLQEIIDDPGVTIPEPFSLALFLIGLGGLAAARRQFG